jgi:hypothetical protein
MAWRLTVSRKKEMLSGMTNELDQLANAVQSRPADVQQRVVLPKYEGITRGAGLIGFWAMVNRIIGIIIFAIATLSACVSLWQLGPFELGNPQLRIIGSWAVCCIVAVAFEVWATILRLYAELCYAQRDIAVNTFLLRYRR